MKVLHYGGKYNTSRIDIFTELFVWVQLLTWCKVNIKLIIYFTGGNDQSCRQPQQDEGFFHRNGE